MTKLMPIDRINRCPASARILLLIYRVGACNFSDFVGAGIGAGVAIRHGLGLLEAEGAIRLGERDEVAKLVPSRSIPGKPYILTPKGKLLAGHYAAIEEILDSAPR